MTGVVPPTPGPPTPEPATRPFPPRDVRQAPRPELPSVSQRRLDAWAFIRMHAKFTFACCAAAATLLAADAWLVYKRGEYQQEVARLRHGMTAVERQRADVVFAANKDKVRVMYALIRRQAEGDRALHLTVAMDRSEMYLELEGVRLREMPIAVGPEQLVGAPSRQVPVAAPLGQRTVIGVDKRTVTLNGGTTIYADSGQDDLSGPTPPTPGNVRVRDSDLEAIMPDVKPGMTVYFDEMMIDRRLTPVAQFRYVRRAVRQGGWVAWPFIGRSARRHRRVRRHPDCDTARAIPARYHAHDLQRQPRAARRRQAECRRVT